MSPQRYIFRRQQRWYSSPFYIFTLLVLILSGLFVTQGFRRGEIEPLFEPTPTPTRVAYSYAQEAETHFRLVTWMRPLPHTSRPSVSTRRMGVCTPKWRAF
jgi:hypothetical protein